MDENNPKMIIATLMDVLREIISCAEIEFTDELAPDTAAAIKKADEALLMAANYLDAKVAQEIMERDHNMLRKLADS